MCLQVRLSVILVSTSFSGFFFIPDIKRNHIHTLEIEQLQTRFEEGSGKELLVPMGWLMIVAARWES